MKNIYSWVITLKRSVLVYINSEKYVKFDNNSLKIPVLVYRNSKKYLEFGDSSGIWYIVCGLDFLLAIFLFYNPAAMHARSVRKVPKKIKMFVCNSLEQFCCCFNYLRFVMTFAKLHCP